MSRFSLTSLTHRSILTLSGADRVRFLQGLVTADIAALSAGSATWTACLTPQGRWQYDFFVIAHPHEPCFLLDCASIQAEALRTFLYRFRLRADINIEHTSFPIHAMWENQDTTCLKNIQDTPPPGLAAYCSLSTLCFPDPRLKAAGWRLINASLEIPPEIIAPFSEYEHHRLTLGLTDSVQDCEIGRTFAAEANMDLLGGISWNKGCYMGQEVTARLHYRHLLKQRLIPVMGTRPLPPADSPIFCDDVEVGRLRSTLGQRGLALLKLDALADPLYCCDQILTAHPPNWMTSAIPHPQT